MAREEHIVIRSAGPADETALEVLAVLDGGHTSPAGPVIVAEAGGRLRAAVGSNGAAISDPFYPSAALVDMLRVRVEAVAGRTVRAPRFAMRRALAA
jgi:hypothetical protein